MSMELKKAKLELMRVTTARMDLELRIDERLEEIERLRGHVQVQLDKELELTNKVKEIQER